MAEPSQSVVLIMQQKTSVKLWVFLLLKFGQWLQKYSSPISLTRLESWLNTSWQILVNALCKGIISHHFKVEGPLGVALDVVLLRDKVSVGSGE